MLQQSPQRREVFCEGLFRVLNARPHMDDLSPHSTGVHTELLRDAKVHSAAGHIPLDVLLLT